jgi:hypothetical protein
MSCWGGSKRRRRWSQGRPWGVVADVEGLLEECRSAQCPTLHDRTQMISLRFCAETVCSR